MGKEAEKKVNKSPEVESKSQFGLLVNNYLTDLGLSLKVFSELTGIPEKRLSFRIGENIDRTIGFKRSEVVKIIQVLAENMEKEEFPFEKRKKLLEAAGYGLVQGQIDGDSSMYEKKTRRQLEAEKKCKENEERIRELLSGMSDEEILETTRIISMILDNYGGIQED